MKREQTSSSNAGVLVKVSENEVERFPSDESERSRTISLRLKTPSVRGTPYNFQRRQTTRMVDEDQEESGGSSRGCYVMGTDGGWWVFDTPETRFGV